MPPQVKPKIILHTKLKQTSNKSRITHHPTKHYLLLICSHLVFFVIIVLVLRINFGSVIVYLHTFCIGWVYEYPNETTLQEKLVNPTPTTTSIYSNTFSAAKIQFNARS